MKVRISLNDPIAIATWIRIVVGSFAAVAGAMMAVMHPHDFLYGISQISLALFLIFMKFRQPNESFQEYIVKPRAVITLALPLISGACALVWLVRRFSGYL